MAFRRICSVTLLVVSLAAAQESGITDYSIDPCYIGEAPSAQRPKVLSQSERETDALQLFAIFAKNYGPYEWKKKRYSYDMLQVNPFWIGAVRSAPDDFAYSEVLIDWLAQLKDAHVQLLFPSGWEADMDLALDAFDIVQDSNGNIVDYRVRVLRPGVCYQKVDRNGPMRTLFTPQPGDEVITFEGLPVKTTVAGLLRYAPGDNPRTRLRAAVDMLTRRRQRIIPSAPSPATNTPLGISGSALVPTVRIGFRLAADGTLREETINWRFRGAQMQFSGVPLSEPSGAATAGSLNTLAAAGRDPLSHRTQGYLPVALQRVEKSSDLLSPAFRDALPYKGLDVSTCGTRLFCGELTLSNGLRAGYVRVPSFDPDYLGDELASDRLSTVLQRFRTNSSIQGVVVDLMGNGGGDIRRADGFASRILTGVSYRAVGFQIRATASWVADFDAFIEQAWSREDNRFLGNYLFNRQILSQAVASGARGRTGPLPLNAEASADIDTTDQDPMPPVLILVDEFTGSAAEYVAGLCRFNRLCKIAGIRTAGAGGNVNLYSVGTATETKVSLTESLMSRIPAEGQSLPEDGLAEADNLENVGVMPDYRIDYMTTANLQSRGRLFVDELVRIMEAYLVEGPLTRVAPTRSKPASR